MTLPVSAEGVAVNENTNLVNTAQTNLDKAKNRTGEVSASTGTVAEDDNDEEKIDLKFVFANRDGVQVVASFQLSDTIAEVKGVLMSLWPKADLIGEVPADGDRIRLVCMGKGFLMPDSRTLANLDVPILKYPTPVNVSVKPNNLPTGKESIVSKVRNSGTPFQPSVQNGGAGCCVIS